MYIGAHVSIQGGLYKAPENAAARGCECFQIFTRSPRGGEAKEITAEAAREFKQACARFGQRSWYIHTPYYINLASRDPALQELTVRVVREELERGRILGARAVMTHLGSAKGLDPSAAIKNVVNNVRSILKGYGGKTRLLMENAAGSEAILGRSFQELLVLVEAAGGRCGICLDTQHAFASGYDLRDKNGVVTTLDEFDDVIGLEHLCLIHSNDSKTPLGSGRDRHEHIGKGEIGTKGFRALLNDGRLDGVDFILETKMEGSKRDVAILKRLRSSG